MGRICIIVGGGASGALVALSLVKAGFPQLKVKVIEPALRLGRGKAYPASDATDLLNVPADKMSADPDSPLEFINWLRTHHPDQLESIHWPYVPRTFYGDYLEAKITFALRGQFFEHVLGTVLEVQASRKNYSVSLNTGETLIADFVIICTGYQKAKTQQQDSPVSPLMGGQVLVIGSSLSAFDAWRQIGDENSEHISFISRHGLVPLPHLISPKKLRIPPLHGQSPKQILQLLRFCARAGGMNWQDLADSLRLQVPLIWNCWSPAEKSRFMRHLKVYWECIRHRVPATIHEEFEKARAQGKLSVRAGRLSQIQNSESKQTIQIRLRGKSQTFFQTFDRVVDASGAKIDQSLAKGLLLNEGVKACELGLGFLNEAAPNVWMIGPANKTHSWETTAVPEIRTQCNQLVNDIKKSMSSDHSHIIAKIIHHPESVGESYAEHLKIALSFSGEFAKISLTLLVHAILPQFFLQHATIQLRRLHQLVLSRRYQAFILKTQAPVKKSAVVAEKLAVDTPKACA